MHEPSRSADSFGQQVPTVTAEDAIVSKLEWARKSGDSPTQLADAAGGTSVSRWWRVHTNRWADLRRLLRDLPGGPRIFLRREFDLLRIPITALASVHRRRLRRTRIAVVVGSLGKTTTARALDAVFACPDRKTSYSNYGASLMGNLLTFRPGDAHGVLEVGLMGPGPMSGYARAIRPDLVVVTAIKSDHNRSFPTLFDTRAEKVKMVSALPPAGIALLNGDDPHVRWMATQTRARVVTYGLNADNDVRATDLRVTPERIELTVRVNGSLQRVESRLEGAHMAYPLLAAMTAAHVEGIDLGTAASRLAALRPTTSRMDSVVLADGTRILDDSCKGPLESIHALFETAAALPAARKIVVLGNIEEPQGKRGDLYRDLGRRLAGFADFVIGIGGSNLSGARTGAVECGMDPSRIKLTGSRIPEAIRALRDTIRPGDLVIIKGSSNQRLRRIVLALAHQEVGCRIKVCGVKVRTCDECPLLNAPETWLQNQFVRRYIER